MHPPGPRTSGYTLFELLVVMSVLVVLFGIVALNVRGLHNDAESAAAAVTASLIEVRTQALSTTRAVRVTVSNNDLRFEVNSACASTNGWITLTMPDPSFAAGVTIAPSVSLAAPWSVCYTTRGTLTTPAPSSLTIRDSAGHLRTVSVYLTGSVGS